MTFPFQAAFVGIFLLPNLLDAQRQGGVRIAGDNIEEKDDSEVPASVVEPKEEEKKDFSATIDSRLGLFATVLEESEKRQQEKEEKRRREDEEREEQRLRDEMKDLQEERRKASQELEVMREKLKTITMILDTERSFPESAANTENGLAQITLFNSILV